jgi:phospholipid transport system transporter-binding protein
VRRKAEATASTFALEPKGGNAYVAQGSLDFDSATRALARGLEVLRPGSEVEIDLSQVASGDSAGLAVLIEWLAAARARNVRLRYSGVPQQILAVARISDIEEMLAG